MRFPLGHRPAWGRRPQPKAWRQVLPPPRRRARSRRPSDRQGLGQGEGRCLAPDRPTAGHLPFDRPGDCPRARHRAQTRPSSGRWSLDRSANFL
ncbi:hypothetical protein AB0E59_30675 [Lentzea sp. NPDC034063]|uniref:hypothetical protein n=1 Tax=Lentzea sp. NPDC034063 TaxID=3154912 RepID=UPI0034012CFC